MGNLPEPSWACLKFRFGPLNPGVAPRCKGSPQLKL
jgi:hypothetical protein